MTYPASWPGKKHNKKHGTAAFRSGPALRLLDDGFADLILRDIPQGVDRLGLTQSDGTAGDEPLRQGQLGTMGGLSALASFLVEDPHLPSEPSAWLALILLACVCSCFGFALQPVAQKYTSAETAGLYCAFGPLGAGVLGWICLGEGLSPFAMAGAGLILVSILLAQKETSV